MGVIMIKKWLFNIIIMAFMSGSTYIYGMSSPAQYAYFSLVTERDNMSGEQISHVLQALECNTHLYEKALTIISEDPLASEKLNSFSKNLFHTPQEEQPAAEKASTVLETTITTNDADRIETLGKLDKLNPVVAVQTLLSLSSQDSLPIAYERMQACYQEIHGFISNDWFSYFFARIDQSQHPMRREILQALSSIFSDYAYARDAEALPVDQTYEYLQELLVSHPAFHQKLIARLSKKMVANLATFVNQELVILAEAIYTLTDKELEDFPCRLTLAEKKSFGEMIRSTLGTSHAPKTAAEVRAALANLNAHNPDAAKQITHVLLCTPVYQSLRDQLHATA